MSSTAKPARPLSPHLQIYKPQLTSVMSILHRFSGIWLSLGLPVFLAWLVALVDPSEKVYGYFTDNLAIGLGEVAIFGLLPLIVLYILYRIEMAFVCKIDLKSGRKWVNFTLFVLDFLIGVGVSYQLFHFLPGKYPDHLDKVSGWIGWTMLFGWTWAFMYHFCTGIRHLLWDAGFFLGIRSVYVTGWIAFGISTLATAFVWAKILGWLA